jgi:hypothetical protein
MAVVYWLIELLFIDGINDVIIIIATWCNINLILDGSGRVFPWDIYYDRGEWDSITVIVWFQFSR